MAASIDYQLRDSRALIKAVDSNLTAMKAKGFTDASNTQLIDLTENLKIKEAAQQKAVKLTLAKLSEQDDAVKRVSELIKKIRNAAKSAYGKDEKNLKVYKCDQKIPTSIGKLSSTCEYLAGIVLEQHDILLANGLVQEDVDELNSSYGLLIAANASKENAKKLQKAATFARDEAAEKLKDKVFRIRKFAQACFSGKKEILIEFEAVSKAAGGRPEEEEKVNPETPQQVNPAPEK